MYPYKTNYNPRCNNICGIKNIGNNCYLNSGLQIIASCDELVYELNNSNNKGKFVQLLTDAIKSLLKNGIYDPTDFITYFSRYNSDFIRGSQCCSQNFIRTLIKNINHDYKLSHFNLIKINAKYKPENQFESIEYNKFLNSSHIYPESKAQSIFSGITKSYSYGKCKCKQKIEQYSFSFFIDLNLYLDEIDYDCSFTEVLKQNIGMENNVIMDCPSCKEEIILKEKTTIIKLPEILIFTLERYQGPFNDVNITPNQTMDMSQYLDKSLKENENETKYELFAINIRLGRNANFGHEICQVKRKGKWYEINDSNGREIKGPGYNNYSYGLFYRKKNNNLNIKLVETEEEITSTCCGSTSVSKSMIKYDNNNNLLSNKNYLICGLNVIALFDNFYKELKTLNDNDLPEFTKITKQIIKTINDNKSINDNNDLFIKFKNYIEKDSDFNKENKNFTQNFILGFLKKINKELSKIKKINVTELYIPNEKEKNDYDDFIKNKNIDQESQIISIFSYMIKSKNKNKVKNKMKYYFDYFIDLKIDLNKYNESKYDTQELLNEYFNFDVKKKTVENKIIKLPDILIITIERNKRKTKIKPKESIILDDYCEKLLKKENTKLKFELFAVYLRTELNIEICQVKKDQWYEVSDTPPNKATTLTSDYHLIHGLFYKRK